MQLDLGKRQVRRNNEEIRLTPLEYKLLVRMVRDADMALTHRKILTDVGDADYAQEARYLRVFMRDLGEKVEEDPTKPQFLVTEPGVGHRLLLP